MTSQAYPDVVERARSHLASALGCVSGDIAVVAVEPVQWNDGSLGCGRPGMHYTQSIVPGYRVRFSYAGRQYWYHTDRRLNVVPCPDRFASMSNEQ